MVTPLRQACARERSFVWLAVSLAGICARQDLLGVTSIVRTLGLTARCYDRLLDFFHSPAVNVDRLTCHWVQQAMKVLPVHRFAGRPVLLGDGIKIPKSGRRMPAVQVVSVLVAAAGSFFAVPLAGRIHEGVKFTNRDHRTLPQKCCDLLETVRLGQPFYLVADAYYACATVAHRLRVSGSHLVSRLRRNAVAYAPAPPTCGPRQRGRPRLYGRKIKLWNLFKAPAAGWQQADSPVYGERGVTPLSVPRSDLAAVAHGGALRPGGSSDARSVDLHRHRPFDAAD